MKFSQNLKRHEDDDSSTTSLVCTAIIGFSHILWCGLLFYPYRRQCEKPDFRINQYSSHTFFVLSAFIWELVSILYLLRMRISKLCYLGICSIAMAIGLLSCTEEPAIVAVTSVTLDSTSITLVEGDSQTLTATVSPSNAENQKVLWSSSNSSVASVKEGVVTALKVGNATITAKTDDGGKTATCKVIVETKDIPVTGVTLDKTSYEMTEGDEFSLTATVNPENATNKNISWSSSNPSVATVNNGKIKALKAGTATITVKTDDGGKTATCEVTVNAMVYPVESISLDKTSYKMIEGEEITLIATVNPENATNKNISWGSSNTAVASVDNGKVTALKAGTTIITVKTEDGNKTATCEVTVREINDGDDKNEEINENEGIW